MDPKRIFSPETELSRRRRRRTLLRARVHSESRDFDFCARVLASLRPEKSLRAPRTVVWAQNDQKRPQDAPERFHNSPERPRRLLRCLFICWLVSLFGWLFGCFVVWLVVCEHLGVSRSIWEYLEVSVSIWEYSGVSGSIWKCLRASGTIFEHLGVSGSISKYLGVSLNLGVSGSIWNCLKASGNI